MTYSSASQLGPEFENFLFAPIGADRNGMLLSVLSALARLDIDPWQEAAQLAGVAGETATRRLLIIDCGPARRPIGASQPGDECRSPDRAPAASGRIKDRPARGSAQRRCGNPVAAITYVYVIFMVIALSAQWIAAGRQPPAQVGNVQAPTSSTVSPAAQPPISK